MRPAGSGGGLSPPDIRGASRGDFRAVRGERVRRRPHPPGPPHGVRSQRVRANAARNARCTDALAASAVGGGVRRSGGECYNPRMNARRSSSGKGALRERRRRGRLSRVALLAAGEQERERRIEVAAARSAGLSPSELPPEQAAKFRAAVAAVRAGDIPACIVCAGDMILNGNVPGGRWECPGGCFAFSISVGD